MSPFTSEWEDVKGKKMVKYIFHKLYQQIKTNAKKQHFLPPDVLHTETEHLLTHEFSNCVSWHTSFVNLYTFLMSEK